MPAPLLHFGRSAFEGPSSSAASVAMGGLILCALVSPDLLAASTPGNGSASEEAGISTIILVVLFGLALVALAALIIGGLTLWGKKQDDINHMMSFCIKYLIDTQNEAEKCEAAAALGAAKEPGALLVLLDVIVDQEADDSVREAAAGALREMGRNYRRYRKIIEGLRSAVKDTDHQKIIDLLTSNFEGAGKKYVQTAYVIGREHMRLGNYEDAREWLRVAAFRNQKTLTYGNQIKKIMDECNAQLFAAGDRSFRAGYFHDAKAHYAVASHGLDDEENKRFASYLRQASVYCKLEDFQDADEALLQALQHHHQTDLTLSLNKLLQKRLHPSARLTAKEREHLDAQIDECVSDIMKTLTTPSP